MPARGTELLREVDVRPAGRRHLLPEPLGVRDFTIANGPTPGGSHLFSSATGGGDVATQDSFQGTIALRAGAPGPDGVASLAVAADAIVAFATIDGGIVCTKIEATGSSGKLDCDGGTPVDVRLTQDSNGSGPPSPPVLQLEQGAPGPAGSGYVVVNARILQCPSNPSCSLVGSPSDCFDERLANYGAVPAAQGAFTTGTGTATVQEPSQGGSDPTLSHTGAPFQCGSWVTDGPGILVAPVPAMDTIVGDLANVLQLDD